MARISQCSTRFIVLGLLLAVGFGLGSCQAPSQKPGANDETAQSGLSPGAAAAAEDPAAIGGYQSTPINPPRIAYLTSQQDTAQINMRSQPTTESSSLGYGKTGDEVQLLRLAEGEGGYSWYFLKFTYSGEEGWIRGDFIDTSGQANAAATSDTKATEKEENTSSPCGRDRQEAHFETTSFSIYICKLGTGLRYVGIEKDTQESLVTEDVRKSQGIYIAIQDNYQFHINDKALAIYQISDGAYNQIVAEEVIRYEQFIY
jgi:hypothetical protein